MADSVTDLLTLERRGPIALLRLNRPAKRNAVNDSLVLALRDAFEQLDAEVRAVVIAGEGEHFCAGLDLGELRERDAEQGLYHSRMWHKALDACLLYTSPSPRDS